MTINWIIFDAMGVIFKESNLLTQNLIPFIQTIKNIDEEKIKDLYYKTTVGELTSFTFWTSLGLKEYFPEIEFDFLYNNYTLDSEFLDVYPKFRKNYSLGLFSNHIKEWINFLTSRFDLNNMFDQIISSGEAGVRKPNKKIFELLLNRIQAEAQECIFVDDQLKNLTRASQLGFYTIRFIKNTEKTGWCSEFEVSSFQELFTTISNFF
jgi:FMN phosphatase YigB (HAD superfamily)